MTEIELTRRAFIAAATTAAGAWPLRVNAAGVVPGKVSPNEKLNIAGVGVGSMGKANLEACETENIVALCDVDDAYAAKTFAQYPDARRFRDFRQMFDAMAGEIDAVVIATPDHTHAAVALPAMRLGKHVYCQKPLAHGIGETHAMMQAARETGVVTQMGNQGHSSEQTRQLREWFEDGAIGAVREVHAWSDRPVGGDPWSTFPVRARPGVAPPVPATLDWDLWLGPAPARPYHRAYHPLAWRGWLDFGTGALGDMGAHIIDPAFFALRLEAPEYVEATTTHWERDIASETYPRASIVRYHFPRRGGLPPLDLTWYDGRLMPPVARDFAPDERYESNGALIVGERGSMIHGSHGAGRLRLLPEARRKDYEKPARSLPRVEARTHEQDWIQACKGGAPCCSPFAYGGALTELLLLGVIAMRFADRRLGWDAAAGRFANSDEANALLAPPRREGWAL